VPKGPIESLTHTMAWVEKDHRDHPVSTPWKHKVPPNQRASDAPPWVRGPEVKITTAPALFGIGDAELRAQELSCLRQHENM